MKKVLGVVAVATILTTGCAHRTTSFNVPEYCALQHMAEMETDDTGHVVRSILSPAEANRLEYLVQHTHNLPNC